MAQASAGQQSLSRLTQIGPAILLTATSVGAGDILTGSLAGAEAGTAVLWAVPVGVILKWTLTEGVARWQMATGTTLLEGCVSRYGQFVRWVFLVYLVLFSLVTGGMLSSACGVAATAVVPIGEPQTSRLLWGAAHAAAGLALVLLGGYELLKRVLAVCVGAMFATVTLTAFLLAPDWAAAAAGLIPSIPAAGPGWVVALIGAIGGTMAIVSYGYWVREENRSGKEGLAACRYDLLLSYVVIAIFGAAVVIIGSRVRVTGQGVGLAVLLADQLGASLGPAGRGIFLAGFWATVFAALLGVWQSLPYLFADVWRLGGAAMPANLERSRPYRIYLALLATVPLLLLRWPVQELQLAFGVTGAMLLPMLAAVLLLMNNRIAWVGAEFRSTRLLNLVLAAALAFFAVLGASEIARLLG
jgi:Mn2+/Fe2+ NRAMP family transporter